MAGLISVTAIGNLGRDPETRFTQGGDKIVNLNVAVSETWRDKASGERKERTEWLRVVVFNPNVADIAEKYLRKGSKVAIHNAGLVTRKWTDQSGAEKYTTEVVLSRFKGELVLLDSKGGGSRDDDEPGGGRGGRSLSDNFQDRARAQDRPFDDDSDIPF